MPKVEIRMYKWNQIVQPMIAFKFLIPKRTKGTSMWSQYLKGYIYLKLVMERSAEFFFWLLKKKDRLGYDVKYI